MFRTLPPVAAALVLLQASSPSLAAAAAAVEPSCPYDSAAAALDSVSEVKRKKSNFFLR